MRKLLLLVAVALIALAARAVPAVPHPIEVTQPDGTKLTMRIIGDEFFNYHTTVDGYTIVKNSNGFYVYGVLKNDVIIPTAIVAHNAETRSASEATFLKGVKKHQYSQEAARQAMLKRAPVDAATRAAGLKVSRNNYSNFRGLIILVDYYDCLFSRSDIQNFYYRMVNEQNYNGFTNEDGTPNDYGECTGSVRDYYYDNSLGLFSPTFDVVGPVTLTNYSVDDHNKTANSAQIWAAALQQIDPQVDFSQYDTDNNGNIDMIFFIGAGSGSNSDGTTTHLWPHKYDLYWQYLYLDGKRARTYACSTEYLYNVSYGIIDGIGTICHEFSHVLGLPDLYDTDYADSGGESQHPGDWDIMSGGSYQNNSRTPVAYSLYDRYSIGFANAQVINAAGNYSLNQVGNTGDGYIINSPEPNVKFYLENRQNTKWDTYAPGHGLIICRVDSTNSSMWTSNKVNCNPSHNYYVLLRAGNGTETEQADDAFPTGATFINNTTTPNLKTWNGTECQYNIDNIVEQNGVISFTINNDGEVPVETISLATLLTEGVDGEEYTIDDDLAVVEVVPTAGLAFLSDGNNNWIKVDAGSYYETIATMSTVASGSLKGTFTGKDFIPTITLSEAPEEALSDMTVLPKTYVLDDEFTPKVNEVIRVGGYYNESDNSLHSYSAYPQGVSAALDMSWYSIWVPTNGTYYSILGITQIREPWAQDAPALRDYDHDFQNYLIYPLEASTITAVETLSAGNGDGVVNVYNMQGQLLKHGVNASTAAQGLQRGIYLIGGKKVVIK